MKGVETRRPPGLFARCACVYGVGRLCWELMRVDPAHRVEDGRLTFGDGSGGSVAISGTTAIVGAYLHANPAGLAYLFEG